MLSQQEGFGMFGRTRIITRIKTRIRIRIRIRIIGTGYFQDINRGRKETWI